MPNKQPQKNSTSLIKRPQSEARKRRRPMFTRPNAEVLEELEDLEAGIKRPRERGSSDMIDSSDTSDSDQENIGIRPRSLSDDKIRRYEIKRKILSQKSSLSQFSYTSSFDSIVPTQMFDNGKKIGPEANPSTTWKYGKCSLSKNFNKTNVMSSDSDDNQNAKQCN